MSINLLRVALRTYLLPQTLTNGPGCPNFYWRFGKQYRVGPESVHRVKKLCDPIGKPILILFVKNTQS